ncbi:MAG: hypothetical protein HY936_08915 [Nitrosomonadales bacterium]|nr:hypothetical protein [Nitrosomonadales bacterium]
MRKLNAKLAIFIDSHIVIPDRLTGGSMLSSTAPNPAPKELLQATTSYWGDNLIGHSSDTTFAYNGGSGMANLLDLGDRDTIQFGATGYAVDGSAAGEILIDTHYWATSFNGGAGNDSMPLAA